MDLDNTKRRLDLVSHAGGLLLVALYVAGFLVAPFANASRGVVELSLFRARVLSAGVLFLVFLALPILEAGRAFGLFGFAEPP
jgi:hypothetical protein